MGEQLSELEGDLVFLISIRTVLVRSLHLTRVLSSR